MIADRQKSKKSGFTFLEILVVMAILAVLLYMIVQSMANFRRSVELQQASDQIVSGVNETKNFASNNILPDDVVIEDDKIYAYRLSINGDKNNIIRETCSKVTDIIPTSNWVCSVSTKQDVLLADSLSNIIIEPSGCVDVLLINMTNDWQYKTVTSTPDYVDDTFCQFDLRHKHDPLVIFRSFIFDAQQNTFEVQY